MNRQTYIVKRDNAEELTLAAIHIEAHHGIEIRNVDHLKDMVIDACTQWVAETPEGKQAWEESSSDFNIGDLANEKLDGINHYLAAKGVRIVDIDVYSMDAPEGNWVFDTVLVHRDDPRVATTDANEGEKTNL